MPDYEKAARKAAKRHGVDPDIFVRQLRQESGLRPGLTSGAGAQGIAQFIPSTAKAYGVNLHDGRVSDDLDGAARYMRDNLKRYGSYARALSAYNSGRPDAYKDPGFAKGETYNYVRSILNGKNPKPSTSSGGSRGNTRTETTTTTTTPGVDNSALRQQLRQMYVLNRDKPDALLELARGLRSAVDVPGSSSTTVSRSGGGSSQGSVKTGQRPSDQLTELFYDPLGGVKRGKQIGAIGGHSDHVHVASGPKQLASLKKLATDLGLTITSTTGGKHTPGSYHYQGRAIDVAGDPEVMKRYARLVAKRYGVKL